MYSMYRLTEYRDGHSVCLDRAIDRSEVDRLIATRGADEALLVDHEQKTVFLSSHSSWEEFEPGLEIKP